MPAFLPPLQESLQAFWDAYHQLPEWVRGSFQPLTFGLAWGVVIGPLEWLSGGRTRQYLTRGFGQDLLYWFWHSSGLYKLIFSTWLLALLTPYLAVVDVKLLGQLPYVARGVAYYLIAEFIAYWYHRWQHASRFLWAFHTTHHSQQNLSFATFNRFHPIDEFLMDWVTFLPVLMLGASVKDWLPLYYLHKILVLGQHCAIDWRFGWPEKIFVSPTFHSAHHSPDPRFFNTNFGATLSLWDHLFGTAVVVNKRPARFGLVEYPDPTLLSSLVTPFQILWRTYSPRPGVSAAYPAPPPAQETVAPTGGQP